MQTYPCACKPCLDNRVEDCQFQADIGPPDSKIMKNNATSDQALPNIIHEIISQNDGKDFSKLTVKNIDHILRFIDITATRLEPGGNGKRKNKDPLKSCKITAITNAGGWNRIKDVLSLAEETSGQQDDIKSNKNGKNSLFIVTII